MPLDIAKVRQLRVARRLSTAEAARGADLTDGAHWRKIESGRSPNIKLATVEAIARLFKVRVDALLTSGPLVRRKPSKPKPPPG